MALETNKQYDEIVGTIMQNVIAEMNRSDGRIVLWDFQHNQDMDRLYYNIACIVADLYDKQIYLQMPLLQYLRFKYVHRKRKNIHWISRKCKWLKDENKTSIFIIMDFVRAHYGINRTLFKDINEEYYGWEE